MHGLTQAAAVVIALVVVLPVLLNMVVAPHHRV
jgi:hypothetical protein